MFVYVSDVKNKPFRDWFGSFNVNDPFFDEDDTEVVWGTYGGGDSLRVSSKGRAWRVKVGRGRGRCNFPGGGSGRRRR